MDVVPLRQASATTCLTLALSSHRAQRWTEAAEAADLEPSDWAASLIDEFLKTKAASVDTVLSAPGGAAQTGAAQNELIRSAACIAAPWTADAPGPSQVPAWAQMLRILGTDHRDLCIELGRVAEAVAVEHGALANPFGSPLSARYASILTPRTSIQWPVWMGSEHLQALQVSTDSWGVGQASEWAALVVDAMVDRQAIGAPSGSADTAASESAGGNLPGENTGPATAAPALQAVIEAARSWHGTTHQPAVPGRRGSRREDFRPHRKHLLRLTRRSRASLLGEGN